MSISLLLALGVVSGGAHATPLGGGEVWEEIQPIQKIPGYHPSLRFSSESRFAFITPDFIAQGRYQVDGDHYVFTPLSAIELENADVAKLLEEMTPDAKRKTAEAYARSMANFDGYYDSHSGALTVNHKVNGAQRMFQLFPYTAGDEQLSLIVSDDSRGLVGLWHAPDPFPERLDPKTRYRIGGLEGLQQFAGEAQSSDSAQFQLVDLRVDGTFRIHGTIGRWQRNGSTLTLSSDKGSFTFKISPSNDKLLQGGKTAYVRN